MTGRLVDTPEELLISIMFRVSDLFEGRESYTNNSTFYKLLEPYHATNGGTLIWDDLQYKRKYLGS